MGKEATDNRAATGYPRLKQRAQVIKAMAHPTRLLFVEALAGGERCVCELHEMVDADVSTVSRHLAMLKNVGIVDSDRRGQKVFYRLRVPCVLGFFDCVESVLQASGDDAVRCRP